MMCYITFSVSLRLTPFPHRGKGIVTSSRLLLSAFALSAFQLSRLSLRFSSLNKSCIFAALISKARIMEATVLNPTQLSLLQMFAYQDSEEETKEMKNVLCKYYAEKADKKISRIWEERGYTEDTMDEWLNTHIRTPYNQTQQ
jgi:hypothetical protein